jgi:acetylglutamate kinase
VKTIVVKYGGAAMENQTLCAAVAKEIVKLSKDNRVVVVHGGGKEVTSFLDRLGIESKFINGLRFTDKESLQIAEMFYSGTINKKIVSLIQLEGALAVGISGRDAKFAKIKRVPELGFVGEIESVSTNLIETLLKNSYIPVISPISEEESGQPVNVNADEMGRAVAEALKADVLIYLSDVDGLMLKGQVVQNLCASEIKELLTSPEITGGMIPKLKSSLTAVEHGVKKVCFLNGKKPELLQQITSDKIDCGTIIELS